MISLLFQNNIICQLSRVARFPRFPWLLTKNYCLKINYLFLYFLRLWLRCQKWMISRSIFASYVLQENYVTSSIGPLFLSWKQRWKQIIIFKILGIIPCFTGPESIYEVNFFHLPFFTRCETCKDEMYFSQHPRYFLT